MLTRLRVTGFKNLVDVDVHFGPFTCVVGGNGVGKSNLFDAIRFLSALASGTLRDAVRAVRPGGTKSGDARRLFTRMGDTTADRMRFVADMLVPLRGVDAVGQSVEAETTFLRYTLEVGYRADEPQHGGLETYAEELLTGRFQTLCAWPLAPEIQAFRLD